MRMTESRRAALEEALLPLAVALAVVLVVGDLLILAYGEAPGAVWRLLLDGTWGNAYGIGQVLYKATTLTCTGLAVALALRAGLFNIGAEGQLAAGGFGAAVMGLALPTGTPSLLAIGACVAAAALCGSAVGAVPGVLRARFGAHEVIVTIMMNFIVLALLNYVVAAKLHVPETLHTPALEAGTVGRVAATFPAFHGSALNWTIVLVAGGVSVSRTWIGAMALSGAIAGLGGVNFVLGYKGYYEDGFAGGAGFLGIVVALVGRTHPLGVVIAALFFATLSQGGLAINAMVPKQIVEVLQGIVILAIASSVPEVRRLVRKAAGARRADTGATS